MQKIEQGEIYYADLRAGKGSEQAGRRPVLISELPRGSGKKTVITVSPITSKIKSPDLYSHIVLPKIAGLPKQSMVEVEQTTTIDNVRLLERRCCVDENTLKQVKRALKMHFGL